MSETEGSKDWKFFIGFLIGGLLGALVIVFLGTKEGKKARKHLEKKGGEVLDDVMDKLENLKVKGRELAEQGEEIKTEVLESLKDTKEELTTEAAAKIDQTLAHIESIQEKGRVATASLRKKFKNVPKKT